MSKDCTFSIAAGRAGLVVVVQGGFITAVGAMFGATLAFYLSRGRLKEYFEGKLAADGALIGRQLCTEL